MSKRCNPKFSAFFGGVNYYFNIEYFKKQDHLVNGIAAFTQKKKEKSHLQKRLAVFFFSAEKHK